MNDNYKEKPIRQSRAGGKTGGKQKMKAAKGSADPSDAATEVRRLNQKVTKLEMQSDILKKAIALFERGLR